MQWRTAQSVLIVSLFATCAAVAAAQSSKPVGITDERHHHLVMSNENIRVLEVEIQPQQKTETYRHEHDFERVIFAPAEVAFTHDSMGAPMTLAVKEDTAQFLAGGFTETTENRSRSATYHALVVECLTGLKRFGTVYDRETWEAGRYDTFAAPADPQGSYTMTYDTPAIHAENVQLISGTAVTHRNTFPTLVIALTELKLAGWTHEGNDAPLMMRRGEVRWFPDGLTEQLSNDADTPARLVVLQFK